MGLSLGDLTAVRNNAKVFRLHMQISLHESLEKLFPLKWLRRIYEKTNAHRCYPGRPVDMVTWVCWRSDLFVQMMN